MRFCLVLYRYVLLAFRMVDFLIELNVRTKEHYLSVYCVIMLTFMCIG